MENAGTLREAFDYRFSRLDPMGAHIDPPSVAVYETLIAKGPDWGPHPALAESFEVSADGLVWRVRLREGAVFHSGEPCDAAAVLTALEQLRWHEGRHARQLWYWDPVDTAVAEGDDTLVFRLHFPYSRFPSLLWGTHTGVYNEAMRARRAESFGVEVADGTGPFRMLSWSPERVVAERFPAYRPPASGFLASPAAVDRIEWISILDSRRRLAALVAGEVDCLHGVPYAEVDALVREGLFSVHEQPQQSGMYLALDWDRAELGFDDLRVRRAVSAATDRDDLVRTCLAGHGAVTYGPLPPGDEHHDKSVETGRRHDPAAAAALLDAAGFEDPGGGGIRRRGEVELSFECVVQDDEVFRAIAERLAGQLRRIGIDLRLRFVLPFADFYEACAAGPASSISKWLWQDAVDAVIGFSSTSTRPLPNWQHSSVPELDRRYDEWLRAGSDDELRSAAAAVQREFADSLPFVPLLAPNDVWVASKRVRGWTPFQANLYPFYQGVSVDPVT